MVLTTSFDIAIQTEEDRWEAIINDAISGNVKIGQEFPLKLTNGETLEMVVMNIDNNGDVTFGSKNLLINSITIDNVMSRSQNISWKDTYLRTWMNTELLNMMPGNLRSAIKEKTSTYRIGNTNNRETASDKLWVPSIENISAFGTNDIGVPYSGYPVGPDSQLEYYKTPINRAKRRIGSSGYPAWWTSVAHSISNNRQSFYQVTITGSDGVSGQYFTAVNNGNGYVSPHFILGR